MSILAPNLKWSADFIRCQWFRDFGDKVFHLEASVQKQEFFIFPNNIEMD